MASIMYGLLGLFGVPNPRQVSKQTFNFLKVVASALFMWKVLSLLTNTESPVVVVLSESMEPLFQRGDLLVLTRTQAPLRVGDICVYNRRNQPIPIVHRIIEVHEPANGTRIRTIPLSKQLHPEMNKAVPELGALLDGVPLWLYDPLSFFLGLPEDTQARESLLLTKGDNNPRDDRGLYHEAVRGQLWIGPEDVTGRVAAHVPYLVACVAIFSFLSKEPQ